MTYWDRCRTFWLSYVVCSMLTRGVLSLLLLAATDTTSTTVARIVQLLAENQDVQETLRRELQDATVHTGRTLLDMDYDEFVRLRYLEAVVCETIRM